MELPEPRADGKCGRCAKWKAITTDGRFCRRCLQWVIDQITPPERDRRRPTGGRDDTARAWDDE